MPDLSFRVDGAGAVQFAAAPLLRLDLRIDNAPPEEAIHTVALRCQIQIEATRRHYTPDEQTRLTDLFGEPDRWTAIYRNFEEPVSRGIGASGRDPRLVRRPAAAAARIDRVG